MDADLPKIRVDLEGRRVWLDSRRLDLTRMQFEVLAHLAVREGQAVPRQELLEGLWGPNYVGDGKVLDMQVSYVRRILGDDPARPHYIATIRGVGFRLEHGTVEIVQASIASSDPGTRIVTVKRGEVLAIGNVGPVSERVAATAAALRDQLGLAGVLLFEGDVDMTALPGGAL